MPHSSKTASKGPGAGNLTVSVISPSTPSESLNSPCMLTHFPVNISINSPILVASPSTPSVATRATTAYTSHPSVLSRHRSSSATNPSGITSPLSPSNTTLNNIDQSMSPPTISQSMPNTAARTNPLTTTTTKSEPNIDTSISVR